MSPPATDKDRLYTDGTAGKIATRDAHLVVCSHRMGLTTNMDA